MKTYTGYFYEAVSRRVEFATEAESEDEARANVREGNALFDIDGDVIPLDGFPKDLFFDGEPQLVTLSPENAQEIRDMLNTLASLAGGDKGLGCYLAAELESARKLLQP